MPAHHFQHVLIQTADIDGTVAWWEQVMGMEQGPHPDFGFPVVWLYLEGRDVLHITAGGAQVSANREAYLKPESRAVHGTGVLDHVAWHATDLPGMLARLRAQGVAFTARQSSDGGLFQVFMLDPNGVRVELNFPGEEATRHGIQPDLRATDLPRE